MNAFQNVCVPCLRITDNVEIQWCDSMLVISCLLLDSITVCTLCVFYSVRNMRYRGSVSDHLGPSALINLISFDLNTRKRK